MSNDTVKAVKAVLVKTFDPQMQDFFEENKMRIREYHKLPALAKYAQRNGIVTPLNRMNIIAYDKTMPAGVKCERCGGIIGTRNDDRIRAIVLDANGEPLKNQDGSVKECGQATVLLGKDGEPRIADLHSFCKPHFQLPDGAEWMSHIQAQKRLGQLRLKREHEAKEQAKADAEAVAAKSADDKRQEKQAAITAELAEQLQEAGMLDATSEDAACERESAPTLRGDVPLPVSERPGAAKNERKHKATAKRKTQSRAATM